MADCRSLRRLVEFDPPPGGKRFLGRADPKFMTRVSAPSPQSSRRSALVAIPWEEGAKRQVRVVCDVSAGRRAQVLRDLSVLLPSAGYFLFPSRGSPTTPTPGGGFPRAGRGGFAVACIATPRA